MVPNFGIHYMYPTDVKGIKPVSRFRQNINNSMFDDYNANINSWGFNDYISYILLFSLWSNAFYVKQLY